MIQVDWPECESTAWKFFGLFLNSGIQYFGLLDLIYSELKLRCSRNTHARFSTKLTWTLMFVRANDRLANVHPRSQI